MYIEVWTESGKDVQSCHQIDRQYSEEQKVSEKLMRDNVSSYDTAWIFSAFLEKHTESGLQLLL